MSRVMCTKLFSSGLEDFTIFGRGAYGSNRMSGNRRIRVVLKAGIVGHIVGRLTCWSSEFAGVVATSVPSRSRLMARRRRISDDFIQIGRCACVRRVWTWLRLVGGPPSLLITRRALGPRGGDPSVRRPVSRSTAPPPRRHSSARDARPVDGRTDGLAMSNASWRTCARKNYCTDFCFF